MLFGKLHCPNNIFSIQAHKRNKNINEAHPLSIATDNLEDPPDLDPAVDDDVIVAAEAAPALVAPRRHRDYMLSLLASFAVMFMHRPMA